MSARERVAGFWDDVTAAWMTGADPMPDPLPSWFGGYRGPGGGRGHPRRVRRAVGRADGGEPGWSFSVSTPAARSRNSRVDRGLFADEIRATGGFTGWAATAPYSRPPWTDVHGRNRYHDQRVSFARRFYDDPVIAPADVLAMELYPWHSTSVTGVMSAPRDVLDAMVWAPLAEIDLDLVFAFGRPWEQVAGNAGWRLENHFGAGGASMSSEVASRTVLVYRMSSGQRLIVSWQSGYAGPPGEADTKRLREVLAEPR